MLKQFDFSIDEDWFHNLSRAKAHLEALDPECAKVLFDNLAVLLSDDVNARRDFNQKVFEAVKASALVEIEEGTK